MRMEGWGGGVDERNSWSWQCRAHPRAVKSFRVSPARICSTGDYVFMDMCSLCFACEVFHRVPKTQNKEEEKATAALTPLAVACVCVYMLLWRRREVALSPGPVEWPSVRLRALESGGLNK